MIESKIKNDWGLVGKEKIRVEGFWNKFAPLMDWDKTVICGGLAIRHYLGERDRKFNDVDVAVSSLVAVKGRVSDDFLVSHFHDYQISGLEGHNDEFYLVLIDPVNRVKVDIFDGNRYPVDRVEVEVQRRKVSIQSLECQLAVSMFEVTGVLKGETVEQKRLTDVEGMLKLADIKKSEQMWRMVRDNHFGLSLEEIWDQIKQFIKKNPKLVVENRFKRHSGYKCEYCLTDVRYPLTSLDNVAKIMGYVE